MIKSRMKKRNESKMIVKFYMTRRMVVSVVKRGRLSYGAGFAKK